MSVNDVDLYPWLKQEIQLIADTIAIGKPVLGICLGAPVNRQGDGRFRLQERAQENRLVSIRMGRLITATTPGENLASGTSGSIPMAWRYLRPAGWSHANGNQQGLCQSSIFIR